MNYMTEIIWHNLSEQKYLKVVQLKEAKNKYIRIIYELEFVHETGILAGDDGCKIKGSRYDDVSAEDVIGPFF